MLSKNICMIGLVILVFTFSVAVATATTHCVNQDGSSGCFTLIQNAINASANNDTIIIYPGTYNESITVNKTLTILGKGGPCEVNIIAETGFAINLANGATNTKINNLTLTATSNTGIYTNQAVTCYVRNCIIRNCAHNGIYIDNYNANLYVSNCILYNNSQDGCHRNNGKFYLYSNIIYQNHQSGIWGYECYNEYNCISGNTRNYGNYTSQGIGDITTDPQFVQPDSNDFHIQSGSPCIDSGRPGPAHFDCDGTRNDMGVYGGPYAWCGPGPVVTDLQIIPATVVRGDTFRIQATGVAR